MPVSYLPIITPLLLVGIPLLLLLLNRRAAGLAALIAILLLLAFFLSIFVPGWRLHSKAVAGNSAAQYLYAQWLENHSERIGAVIIWPFEPDVLGGYAWLEKSAAQDYPPAVWLVGVRLKYGTFVPKPADWNGINGNVFPQPLRGQALIDHAVKDLGFMPPKDNVEERYYWQHYRQNLPT